MSSTASARTHLLDAPVSIEQILDWGGTTFVPESKIRELMDGREAITLREMIERKEPRLVLWVILREKFMTERAMHEAALSLCSDLLSRLEQRQVYLDYRCRKLLAIKQRWMSGAISLGELRAAQFRGERLREEILETESPESIAAAEAAWQAANDDGAAAVRAVFYVLDRLENDLNLRRERLKVLINHIRQ